jgi:hypothetical protein
MAARAAPLRALTSSCSSLQLQLSPRRSPAAAASLRAPRRWRSPRRRSSRAGSDAAARSRPLARRRCRRSRAPAGQDRGNDAGAGRGFRLLFEALTNRRRERFDRRVLIDAPRHDAQSGLRVGAELQERHQTLAVGHLARVADAHLRLNCLAMSTRAVAGRACRPAGPVSTTSTHFAKSSAASAGAPALTAPPSRGCVRRSMMSSGSLVCARRCTVCGSSSTSVRLASSSMCSSERAAMATTRYTVSP